MLHPEGLTVFRKEALDRGKPGQFCKVATEEWQEDSIGYCIAELLSSGRMFAAQNMVVGNQHIHAAGMDYETGSDRQWLRIGIWS